MRILTKIKVREQVRAIELLLAVISAFFVSMSIVPMCIMRLCGFGVFEIVIPTIISVPFVVITMIVSIKVSKIQRMIEEES